jgi:RNA polymerase sigma factor (sigma-70 family)
MKSRPVADEILVKALFPSHTPDEDVRKIAWKSFLEDGGEAYIMGYIRNRNAIGAKEDDVFQDVLVALLRVIESGEFVYMGLGKFEAYVKQQIRWTLGEYGRRKEQLEQSIDPCEEASVLFQNAQALDTDDIEIMAQHRVEELHSAMAQLKPEYKEVVEMFLKGFSTGEIADKLGISKVNVRARKSRAMQVLRDTMVG